MHMLQYQQSYIFFVLLPCFHSVSLGINVFLMTSQRTVCVLFFFKMWEDLRNLTELTKFKVTFRVTEPSIFRSASDPVGFGY